MHNHVDDIELMQRIAAHDPLAFRAIYQQYGKAVYSLAYRVLQNATLAEDVTQDTFLKVWQQKAHWDPNKGSLKNWLLTVTHFTAIDHLRQERRQPTLHPDSIEDVEETSAVGQIEANWQEGILLQVLIKQLPDEQALLIDLAFFRGMTHHEIADETRIPLGTVKTRLRSGLQRLRELWVESVKNPQ
ncbi:MAG: sigma-70 family RNA polymerase sigma factor [Chloroflexota bacterium]